MLVRIIRPPMVGVPCFFKCAWGPSVRTCWPNFSRCRKGITTGHRMALTANAIIIASIVSLIMVHSYYVMYGMAYHSGTRHSPDRAVSCPRPDSY